MTAKAESPQNADAKLREFCYRRFPELESIRFELNRIYEGLGAAMRVNNATGIRRCEQLLAEVRERALLLCQDTEEALLEIEEVFEAQRVARLVNLEQQWRVHLDEIARVQNIMRSEQKLADEENERIAPKRRREDQRTKEFSDMIQNLRDKKNAVVNRVKE